MNISKPKDFKHNLHARPDRYSRSGDVLCVTENQADTTKSAAELQISSPTSFRHNLHATRDSKTGEVVLRTPVDANKSIDSDGNDDTSYECNNCNGLYQLWRQDQIKIKELQEETHSMMAMAARLYVNVTKDFHTNTGETEFLGSTNMKEFNESILMIAHAVKEFKQDILWYNSTIQMMKENRRELQSRIKMLQWQLDETKEKIVRNEKVFYRRAERADEELKLLKININDLQSENESLRHNLTNAGVLFREWEDTSSSVSTALNQDMTVKDLKKENEILKRELRQLNEDRHRLQVEYITTMNQLLRPNDPRSVVNSESQGKHVNYNIQAKSVNFMEKSNVTCEKSSESDNLHDVF